MEHFILVINHIIVIMFVGNSGIIKNQMPPPTHSHISWDTKVNAFTS